MTEIVGYSWKWIKKVLKSIPTHLERPHRVYLPQPHPEMVPVLSRRPSRRQIGARRSYSTVNNTINGRWLTNSLQTSLAVSVFNLLRVTFPRFSSCSRNCQISCTVPLHTLMGDFTRITLFYYILYTISYSCMSFLFSSVSLWLIH